MPALYDIPVKRIDGAPSSLGAYKGDVLLVVNVASACGLTPQYEALEKAFEKYQGQGFQVLGFPANEFGAQEPGTNEEIASFCSTKFDVKFPMFEKIVVRGAGQHPLYAALTSAKPDATDTSGGEFKQKLEGYGLLKDLGPGDIMWNFEKFVVNRKGDVVARFAPNVTPDDPKLVATIEAELAKPA
jgi:glutathione peroxidase